MTMRKKKLKQHATHSLSTAANNIIYNRTTFHRHITEDLRYPYEHQNAETVQLKQDLLGFERKKKKINNLAVMVLRELKLMKLMYPCKKKK